MASGEKSGGVFTGNSTGKGASAGVKIENKSGMKMVSSYPQDNVHGVDLPNTMGGSMAGSDTNLSHSLKGASAVQRGSGGGGKTERSGI
jgi:hypothetical protein